MKIVIDHTVYDKIMYWVNKADFEVSGFGKVQFKDGVFQVTDAILLKQEGGATHTDIDPTSLSRAQYELRNHPGDLRFWWHSHVQMPAFMSSTDKDTIKELGANGWLVAAVFNQKEEYETAISYQSTSSFGENVQQYQEKLPLEIMYPGHDEDTFRAWDAQFDANVSKKVVPYFRSGWVYDDTSGGYVQEKAPSTVLTALDPGQKELQQWYEEEEARALGLSVKKYRKLIDSATIDQLTEIDDKIHEYYSTRWGTDDMGRSYHKKEIDYVGT